MCYTLTLQSDVHNSPNPQRAALCRAVSPASLVALTLHTPEPLVWNSNALTHYNMENDSHTELLTIASHQSTVAFD